MFETRGTLPRKPQLASAAWPYLRQPCLAPPWMSQAATCRLVWKGPAGRCLGGQRASAPRRLVRSTGWKDWQPITPPIFPMPPLGLYNKPASAATWCTWLPTSSSSHCRLSSLRPSILATCVVILQQHQQDWLSSVVSYVMQVTAVKVNVNQERAVFCTLSCLGLTPAEPDGGSLLSNGPH